LARHVVRHIFLIGVTKPYFPEISFTADIFLGLIHEHLPINRNERFIMDQETPNGSISLALLQKIARSTQASFDRTLAEAAGARRQTVNARLAGVAQVVGAMSEIQQEFDLVRTCRQHVKGFNSTINPKTEADYLKKAKQMDQWRPDPASPRTCGAARRQIPIIPTVQRRYGQHARNAAKPCASGRNCRPVAWHVGR
jgi:hypothetical protein